MNKNKVVLVLIFLLAKCLGLCAQNLSTEDYNLVTNSLSKNILIYNIQTKRSFEFNRKRFIYNVVESLDEALPNKNESVYLNLQDTLVHKLSFPDSSFHLLYFSKSLFDGFIIDSSYMFTKERITYWQPKNFSYKILLAFNEKNKKIIFISGNVYLDDISSYYNFNKQEDILNFLKLITFEHGLFDWKQVKSKGKHRYFQAEDEFIIYKVKMNIEKPYDFNIMIYSKNNQELIRVQPL